MDYLLAGAAVVAVFAVSLLALFGVPLAIMDELPLRLTGRAIRVGVIAGALVWFSLLVALMIYASDEEETQGPCLREETGVTYDAATKTTRPYTHCVERGTWK